MNASSHDAKLISVIIPARNAATLLGEQLAALTKQTYADPFEVLVVDNGSTDSTAEVVGRYGALLPGLRYIYADEKRGRAFACNVGARKACGDRLIFIDADDVAAPGWLAAMAQALECHPVVAGGIDVEQLNCGTIWRPKPFTSATAPALGFLPYMIGANMAMWREAFEAVGGFAEELLTGSDIDISWRLQLAGYTIKDAPDAVMYYRYRQGLGPFWKQIVQYGECHVLLYVRYRDKGMPRSSLKDFLRRVRWLLRHAPALVRGDHVRRSRWLYTAAGRWGRIRGCLRYRTLYL